jgi:hypothetical protein
MKLELLDLILSSEEKVSPPDMMAGQQFRSSLPPTFPTNKTIVR